MEGILAITSFFMVIPFSEDRGITGNSLEGIQFKLALNLPVEIVTFSLVVSISTLTAPKLCIISRIVLAGTVISPESITSQLIVLIIPTSKFVADRVSFKPSAERRILPKTGKLAFTPTDL